jgi:hypothetical protein
VIALLLAGWVVVSVLVGLALGQLFKHGDDMVRAIQDDFSA